MQNNRFSAVQLTLLSVIVALILESLLNQLSDPEVGWNAWLPWLQASVIALTVIAIWSGFALILTTSGRKPSAVDFIYPFGLLIALTLATNSLGATQLASFFCCVAAAGAFACWALYAEWRELINKGQAGGVRRALNIQGASTLLSLFMAGLTFATTPPLAVANFALIIAALLQVFAALGTMTGWRFVVTRTEASRTEVN